MGNHITDRWWGLWSRGLILGLLIMVIRQCVHLGF